MLDIKFVRENPEIVKENIKKKFQDAKLPLVDEVIALDKKSREIKQKGDNLRSEKNKASKEIGALMAKGMKAEADEIKKKITEATSELGELEAEQTRLNDEIK